MAITKVRVKVNGVWSNLTQNSSTGKWEGTITAPVNTSYTQTGGYYPVTVEATNSAGTVVTKDATDATIGQALRLIVKETIKPVIKLIQPSNGAYVSNNKMSVVFEVTDESSGSGVNCSSVELTVGSDAYTESSMTKSVITNGYRYIYTPDAALSDGVKNITINAQDNDGNEANTVSASFTVDTVPPTLTISRPQDNLITNQSSIIVQGMTNDALSSPVTVKVRHESNTYTTSVDSSGIFAQALNLVEGENIIIVTATDAAGKETKITLNVLLDTSVPEVRSVVFTPNPVNASGSVLITLEVE